MPEVMGSKRLDWLRRERDEAVATIESITERAVDEDRDLTDAEQKTCEARRSRLTELDDDIKVESEMVKRSADYQTLIAGIGPAAASATYVPKGCVLGFDAESGRPKLVVNLSQARLQKVAFKPEFLKLARVIA